jgi:hypothetical protein
VLCFILSLTEYICFLIQDPKDAVLFENVGGLVIPNIYLGVAASIILLPWKRGDAGQEGWPLLRCLLLFLWALLGQLPEPLSGVEVARGYRLFCLGFDAIFLSRLALARIRQERNQDWRYYCVLVIFTPAICMLIMSLKGS